jgi:hypothetical protein
VKAGRQSGWQDMMKTRRQSQLSLFRLDLFTPRIAVLGHTLKAMLFPKLFNYKYSYNIMSMLPPPTPTPVPRLQLNMLLAARSRTRDVAQRSLYAD